MKGPNDVQNWSDDGLGAQGEVTSIVLLPSAYRQQRYVQPTGRAYSCSTHVSLAASLESEHRKSVGRRFIIFPNLCAQTASNAEDKRSVTTHIPK